MRHGYFDNKNKLCSEAVEVVMMVDYFKKIMDYTNSDEFSDDESDDIFEVAKKKTKWKKLIISVLSWPISYNYRNHNSLKRYFKNTFDEDLFLHIIDKTDEENIDYDEYIVDNIHKEKI